MNKQHLKTCHIGVTLDDSIQLVIDTRGIIFDCVLDETSYDETKFFLELEKLELKIDEDTDAIIRNVERNHTFLFKNCCDLSLYTYHHPELKYKLGMRNHWGGHNVPDNIKKKIIDVCYLLDSKYSIIYDVYYKNSFLFGKILSSIIDFKKVVPIISYKTIVDVFVVQVYDYK